LAFAGIFAPLRHAEYRRSCLSRVQTNSEKETFPKSAHLPSIAGRPAGPLSRFPEERGAYRLGQVEDEPALQPVAPAIRKKRMETQIVLRPYTAGETLYQASA
jgi:hypothetical protein